MGIIDQIKRLNPLADGAADRDGVVSSPDIPGRRRSYKRAEGFSILGGGFYQGTTWNYTALYRCITLLSSAVATPRIFVVRDNGSSEPEKFDPLKPRKPGEDIPATVAMWARMFSENKSLDGRLDNYRFRECMMLELLDRGNVFLHYNEGMLSLVRLTGGETGYMLRVCDQVGETYQVAAPDLIHIAMPSSQVFESRYGGLLRGGGRAGTNFIRGTPPALIVNSAAQIGIAAEDYVLDYLTRALMPLDAFVFSSPIGEEGYNKSRTTMSKQGESPWPLVMGSDDEFQQVKLTSGAEEAAKLDAFRDRQVEQIARAFGIPPPLVGLSTSSWATGINQLNWKYERHTLNPYFKRIEGALSNALLPPGWKFWHDRSEYRLGDVGDLIQMLPHVLGNSKQGRKSIMSVDELRRFFGLFPATSEEKPPPVDLPEMGE